MDLSVLVIPEKHFAINHVRNRQGQAKHQSPGQDLKVLGHLPR
jgi:hypothetical protein